MRSCDVSTRCKEIDKKAVSCSFASFQKKLAKTDENEQLISSQASTSSAIQFARSPSFGVARDRQMRASNL